jgi:hypothetical protein
MYCQHTQDREDLFPLNKEELLQCAILTILIMGAGHLYYKKTYFRWLSELEKNLKELKEEAN